MDINRIKNEFRRIDRNEWIYADRKSAEWLINRVIAVCRYRPDSTGLVSDHPTEDLKAQVWVDNIGYCGDLIGCFDYCENLRNSFEQLGDFSALAASRIWDLSERLQIPLGEHAPIVFEEMNSLDPGLLVD